MTFENSKKHPFFYSEQENFYVLHSYLFSFVRHFHLTIFSPLSQNVLNIKAKYISLCGISGLHNINPSHF